MCTKSVLWNTKVIDQGWIKNGKTTGCPQKNALYPIFEYWTLGGVFLGVKNNSKNFGNKKLLGCLAKFWVNEHCLSEKCRFFGVFMSDCHVKNGKLFLNAIKVNICAYTHINIKYFAFFLMIFDLFKLEKSWKFKKIRRFWI